MAAESERKTTITFSCLESKPGLDEAQNRLAMNLTGANDVLTARSLPAISTEVESPSHITKDQENILLKTHFLHGVDSAVVVAHQDCRYVSSPERRAQAEGIVRAAQAIRKMVPEAVSFQVYGLYMELVHNQWVGDEIPVPDEEHGEGVEREIFATAADCMDGRTKKPVSRFIRNKTGARFVDTPTRPGVVGRLGRSQPDKAQLDEVVGELGISIVKHNSRGLVVAGHAECAGDPVDELTGKLHVVRAANAIVDGLDSRGYRPVPVYPVYVRRETQREIELRRPLYAPESQEEFRARESALAQYFEGGRSGWVVEELPLPEN